MSIGNDQGSKKQSKWKNKFRLVILNDETFAERSSFRISLLNIYVALSSFVLLLAILIILAIIYTPLKTLIPGYANFENNSKVIKINNELDSIAYMIESNGVYLNSFRRMLTASDGTDGNAGKDEVDEYRTAIDLALKNNEEIRKGEKKEEKVSVAKKTNKFFIPPVSGTVSAEFMPMKKHIGIDIVAAANSPIKSISDGYVIISGWNLETGNTIGVQHDDSFVSFYKHNSTLLKEEGTFVKAGEVLAIIGNSGEQSDGPHLHFELWNNGNPVDPKDYINFN